MATHRPLILNSGVLAELPAGDAITGAFKPRVNSQASASNITPDIGSYDAYEVTALAVDLTINDWTGDRDNLTEFRIVIASNDSGHSITWDEGYIGDSLPTSIAAYDVMELVFYYHAGEGAMLLRSQSSYNFSVYDADAIAYFAAMSSEPDATRKGHLNTLIAGLKADGVWAKLDWLSIFAAHDAQAARLNAINPAQAFTEVNSPVFTADTGYRGAASSYLNSNWVPNADAVNFTLNAASMGGWSLTDANTTGAAMGTGTRDVLMVRNSGFMYAALGSTASTPDYISNATSLGYFSLCRETSNDGQAYMGASELGSDAISKTTIALDTVSMKGLAQSGSSIDTNRTYSALFWGGYLTAADNTALRSRLSTYLTAVGAI